MGRFSWAASLFVLLFTLDSAWAIRLSDYRDRGEFEIDIRFTNPDCGPYRYDSRVENRAGDRELREKPENVYCQIRDGRRSAARSNSPASKILSWINRRDTEEVFLAFLSFSNSSVRRALCEAVEDRNVKIRMVLDSGTDLEAARSLQRCEPRSKREEDRPEIILRGGEGGIGYAHNKLILINPNDPTTARIAFGSANLSSGVVLHHENWNFITVSQRSYFAQVHQCLRRGLLDDRSAQSRNDFSRFIAQCRRAINAPEEEDIKVFLVPGEGEQAEEMVIRSIYNANTVHMAAHRFSNGSIVKALRSKLRRADSGSLRLVLDDDTFWAGISGEQVGGLGPGDYRGRVAPLERAGLQVKYMETNHHSSRLLHHNKFMIFDFGRESAVWTGAGNFTSAAFSRNYENFYYIENSEIVNAYKRQYEYMWEKLATAESNLPERDIAP